jgi:hypothetical protein
MLNIITARCLRAIGRGVSRAGTNYIFAVLLPPSQRPRSHLYTTPTKVARDPGCLHSRFLEVLQWWYTDPARVAVGSVGIRATSSHACSLAESGLQPRLRTSTARQEVTLVCTWRPRMVTVALWRSRDGMLRFRLLLFISTVPGLASARLDEGAGCWSDGF